MTTRARGSRNVLRSRRARIDSGRRCIELTDSTSTSVPAAFLLRGANPRDPNAQIGRLAAQFVTQNRQHLSLLGTEIDARSDGTSISLRVTATTTIGAVPLVSPTTGRTEYGLIVRPRFEWRGLGAMLAEMGWRVIPAPLALPLLPYSERKIPPWVLSTIVLFRIERLLRQVRRRFEVVEEERAQPRGRIVWAAYATRSASRARFLQVPCRFPDLRYDRHLRGAIKFTLRRHLTSLEGQRVGGVHVVALIALCARLLHEVADVPAQRPGPRELLLWLRAPLAPPAFRDGIEAIEWTTAERGLAGPSDLQGLPWAMSMEEFFEAWCESVLVAAARRVGGTVTTGRQRKTLRPLRWDPPYTGSQQYLLPDLVLDRGDLTVIVDAKYKEHWEELQIHQWRDIAEELRERHRADLLQVLAYANLSESPRTVVCLAYPCRADTWKSLADRGLRHHRASVYAGAREIELLLTAFPMGVPATDVAGEFVKAIVRE